MKKSQVLKLVPQAKELKKALKVAHKAADKAQGELAKLEDQLFAIDGVTVENNFPIRVVKLESGNVEVYAACDEVSRSATVTQDLDGVASVFGYFGFGESSDLGNLPAKDALALAKHFVITGKTALPKPRKAKAAKGIAPVASESPAPKLNKDGSVPKKRGRPRKNPAAA
jgi:hypothetical protein